MDSGDAIGEFRPLNNAHTYPRCALDAPVAALLAWLPVCALSPSRLVPRDTKTGKNNLSGMRRWLTKSAIDGVVLCTDGSRLLGQSRGRLNPTQSNASILIPPVHVLLPPLRSSGARGEPVRGAQEQGTHVEMSVSRSRGGCPIRSTYIWYRSVASVQAL